MINKISDAGVLIVSYELGASLETLSQLGLQIGTDVPFASIIKLLYVKGEAKKLNF